MDQMSSALYLGLDSSTQGIKAAVISSDLSIVSEAGVNYDADLPQYKTEGGVHLGEGGTVTQPTVMWVEALDMLMGQLKAAGVDFGSIAAVSGSGQQHGTVYWKHGAEATLAALEPGATLASQLAESFSIPNSPNWMDSSTSAQCATLEAALGGAEATADALGSRGYERFRYGEHSWSGCTRHNHHHLPRLSRHPGGGGPCCRPRLTYVARWPARCPVSGRGC
jgi:xylulokinase